MPPMERSGPDGPYKLAQAERLVRFWFVNGRHSYDEWGWADATTRAQFAGVCVRWCPVLRCGGVNGRVLTPLLIIGLSRNTSQRCICDINARIAALAGQQGGHVTRAQLRALGLERGAVQARANNGSLIRVHQGVYALGHLPTNPLDRAHGALLAAGPRSALSGRSAAAYWGLYTNWTYPLELVSPLRRRVPGTHVRLCSTLMQRDIRDRDGLRVTSPARTMLDIAPRTEDKHLHRFHNELRMRRLITNQQLLDVADRNPSHPGAPRLRALAGGSRGEAKRSPFEVDWVQFASRFELPPYDMNVHVAGERIDVLFTPDRLIVELDGWDTHGTRRAFEEDRDQDSEILAITGIPTMRITYDGLHRWPKKQANRINAILSRR